MAAEIRNAGGPRDWALPYWDYTTNPSHRVLPPDFRNPNRPDGTPNPLFVAARNPAANSGLSFLQPRDVDIRTCLTSAGNTLPGGFFGGPPSAHFGSLPGTVELTPHNAIHRAVGLGGGWMADPDLAALDPIFWLHHANIDRLWEVWLLRDPSHRNLSSPYWLSGVTFPFHDETGSVVRLKTQDVLNLADPALDYTYEDLSDPIGGPAPLALAPPTFTVPMKPRSQPELFGATMAPVELGATLRHVAVPTPVSPVSNLDAALLATLPEADRASAGQPRVSLVLEQVTSSDVSPTFDVYLNVPEGQDPASHEDLFVGRAAMFGIAQASDPKGRHGASGQTFAFDVTDLYNRLADSQALDPSFLRVSFVPVLPDDDLQVTVGRIGLYFA